MTEDNSIHYCLLRLISVESLAFVVIGNFIICDLYETCQPYWVVLISPNTALPPLDPDKVLVADLFVARRDDPSCVNMRYSAAAVWDILDHAGGVITSHPCRLTTQVMEIFTTLVSCNHLQYRLSNKTQNIFLPLFIKTLV